MTITDDPCEACGAIAGEECNPLCLGVAAQADVNATTCPRCKRWAIGWPLKRGDRCSPKDWQVCIREPADILAKAGKASA